MAAVLAASGAFPGVAWRALFAVVVLVTAYNSLLWVRLRKHPVARGRRAATAQALVDLAILTTVLWAAGGVECPFLGYYVFHIALMGILAGRRATVLAAVAATAGAAFLALTSAWPALRIGVWDPVPPWDVVAQVTAFITTVGATAYIVVHAVAGLRNREQALAIERDRAALEYEVLSNTLDELEAGLEVVDDKGAILWQNRRAEQLAPLSVVGRSWAAEIDGNHHVYETMVFPLTVEPMRRARIMNLYVDRTHATLAERRLVLAERLASLGRVAQGVAHELNTPLATIRTLATDMRAALRSLATPDNGTAKQLTTDLDESAALIQEETIRLGRITHSLLAGGDLARAPTRQQAPLSAVVERARALVFASVREGPTVDLDPVLDALWMDADPDRLMQVLVNLLQNALDAIRGGSGSRITVRAEPAGDIVDLIVEDDGPGLDPSIEGRLFEPFTTTKPPGQGTGLGLYTSYMLVRAMGGSLTLERREVRGTRATVRLAAGRKTHRESSASV